MKKSGKLIKAKIIAGIIIVIVTIIGYVLYTQSHSEKMTYVGMYNVKVSVDEEVEQDMEGSHTNYITKFVGTDKDFKYTQNSIERYYNNFFEQYTNKESITVPVFKMEDGGFFIPPTTEECTEKEASEYYNDYFYNVEIVFPVYILGLILGAVFLISALRDYHDQKKNQRVQSFTNIFDDSGNINKEAAEAVSAKFKDNPDAAKNLADEMLGRKIYRKNKARYLAEEFPMADPEDIERYHNVSKEEYIAAKKELRSEKYGIFSHKKESVEDILNYKSKKK